MPDVLNRRPFERSNPRRLCSRYLRREDGAVTTDLVVITAMIVSVAIVVAFSVGKGATHASVDIRDQLVSLGPDGSGDSEDPGDSEGSEESEGSEGSEESEESEGSEESDEYEGSEEDTAQQPAIGQEQSTDPGGAKDKKGKGKGKGGSGGKAKKWGKGGKEGKDEK